MTTTPITPRPAATLILVRDADASLEVLMARRTQLAEFAGGAYVFPGGAVDAADHSAELAALCTGLDDAAASKRLGIERGGLGYWIAAIRESFEEVGLLLAHDDLSDLSDLSGLNDHKDFIRIAEHEQDAFDAARRALAAGEASLHAFARARALRLATDRVHYFSHWITQAGRPRRYDTRFFLAVAPRHQQTSHDGSELIQHVWITPADALERHRRGAINLMFPTVKTLEALLQLQSVDAAIDYARTPRPMPAMEPRLGVGRESKKLLVPGDHAYAEIGKLDTEQKGTVSYEITPGVTVRLSHRVRRLTAPNPGAMTGPGTNTYLIGNADTGIAIIDPGPPDAQHIEAIVNSAEGPIRWILCTHTHMDHSPGARLLKARTGAAAYGMLAKHPANQDVSYVPDIISRDGDVYLLAGCTLRVLHTPGHASNQICILLQEEGMLFTGDHIMQGSTVVINPPDGNMSEYFASLQRLLDEPLDWLAPGHGFLMARPREMVERLLVHRRARENKVVNALREAGAASVEQLLASVYDDTPTRLHAVAARSLLAHLQKLEMDGRAAEIDGLWCLNPIFTHGGHLPNLG
jgi:glyoxylase-like metal-dependent hydrolase (beta-lactamase superfamily II)/8-oxo-dGTP pyrophosphatase MutT (NUDIX family)